MTSVTWSRMRTFLAVAQRGSVRAAAAQLQVTEPAVSASVSQVEEHLHTRLLAREGRGVRLTKAGQVYAEYCRTILGLIDESEDAVRLADARQLRIGAVATASESVLPPLLATFLRGRPEVEVSLSVRPRDELFEELRRHETDLVIAGRPPRELGIESRARRPNQLVVVRAPSTDPVPATSTWLLRGPGSGTRKTCLALFERLEIDPPTLTLGTHGAVVAAAREGLGLTLVHADAVAAELATERLAIASVPGTPLDRPWHITTNPAPPISAMRFLEHATNPSEVGQSAFHLQNPPPG